MQTPASHGVSSLPGGDVTISEMPFQNPGMPAIDSEKQMEESQMTYHAKRHESRFFTGDNDLQGIEEDEKTNFVVPKEVFKEEPTKAIPPSSTKAMR